MYVLPYGQMSLWGATVITNLLSAVPVFGQDLVELIWGGFSVQHCAPHDSDIMMKILIYAGKSSNFNIFPLKEEKEKYNTRNIIIKNNKIHQKNFNYFLANT